MASRFAAILGLVQLMAAEGPSTADNGDSALFKVRCAARSVTPP